MARGIVNGGLNGAGGGMKIKSIQRGLVNTGTVLINDIPINTVDASKSIIFINPAPLTSIAYNATRVTNKAVFLNNQTIRLTRLANTSGIDHIWEVIEFEKVKSVQEGSLTLSAVQSGTFSISPVDITKSFISLTFTLNTGTLFDLARIPRYRLVSPTAFQIITYSAEMYDINWKVIELE